MLLILLSPLSLSLAIALCHVATRAPGTLIVLPIIAPLVLLSVVVITPLVLHTVTLFVLHVVVIVTLILIVVSVVLLLLLLWPGRGVHGLTLALLCVLRVRQVLLLGWLLLLALLQCVWNAALRGVCLWGGVGG